MTIKVLSDTALVIEVADTPGPAALAAVRTLAQALLQIKGLDPLEITPGLTAVAVHLRPERDLCADLRRIENALPELRDETSESFDERERVIPVAYGGDFGPDLRHVADHAGLSVEAVVERHLAGRYQVMALGFSPGFPYLAGLDPSLSCPRLNSPRLRVPAGAVGIGGAQTGVYPQELPGGWNLIGRTAQRLFNPSAREPAWLRVGDWVRFERVEAAVIQAELQHHHSRDVDHGVPPSARSFLVEEGGVQTTVQDLGRPGYQHIGVAEGGALDRHSLSVANLLVGNDPGEPALEWALKGPVLRFRADALVAASGAALANRPAGMPFRVNAGEVLDLSKHTRSGRGYLAIAGGILVPPKLESASTHLAAGFGGFRGRALRAGDELFFGPSKHQRVRPGWRVAAAVPVVEADVVTEIRILPGPEWDMLGPLATERMLAAVYRVSPDSDRMGLRFRGPEVEPLNRTEMVSQPVTLGTVQLPPNGQLVVLMADHQSVGGYPRIASVISADISKLGQVPLGGEVRLIETTLAEAQAARGQARRRLGFLQTGLHERFTANA
jgi:KipI family sensor histidine kinase inhibitor